MASSGSATSRPAISRALWLRARTRNALRRGLLIGSVSVLTMVVMLLVLVLIPRRADQVLAEALRQVPADADTLRWLRALSAARATEQEAMQQLDSLRARAANDDSLGVLLARARTAPLMDSYRALAEAPVLREDARVQSLFADLARLDTARAASAALSGPDARYATLTRELVARGSELVARAESLQVSDSVPVDSTWVLAQATASQAAAVADSSLSAARAVNAQRAAERAALRAQHTVLLPPWVMVIAASVIGVAVGMLVALWREFRQPVVADASELSARTGLRVLDASADRDESWSLLHLLLSNTGDVVPQVQLLAQEPALAAQAAVQLAAVAARESRATVLVDGTRRGRTLEPLLAQAPRRRAERRGDFSGGPDLLWDASQALLVGPDQVVDLLWPDRGARLSAVAEPLRRHLGGYDLVVLLSDQAEPRTVPAVRDVVLVLRAGVTPMAWLDAALRSVTAAGRQPRALVLWTGAQPLRISPAANGSLMQAAHRLVPSERSG
ncbi:MAG: hypothetical protein K2Y26_14670 [Gemmatimonadaceae bacterium]|nr:hypothetical protein [Gemmatimonadaceae bacterium]